MAAAAKARDRCGAGVPHAGRPGHGCGAPSCDTRNKSRQGRAPLRARGPSASAPRAPPAPAPASAPSPTPLAGRAARLRSARAAAPLRRRAPLHPGRTRGAAALRGLPLLPAVARRSAPGAGAARRPARRLLPAPGPSVAWRPAWRLSPAPGPPVTWRPPHPLTSAPASAQARAVDQLPIRSVPLALVLLEVQGVPDLLPRQQAVALHVTLELLALAALDVQLHVGAKAALLAFPRDKPVAPLPKEVAHLAHLALLPPRHRLPTLSDADAAAGCPRGASSAALP